ncbi:MAG: hypothetical protein AAF558_10760, partial [Verrucomicrobiota bacterium]
MIKLKIYIITILLLLLIVGGGGYLYHFLTLSNTSKSHQSELEALKTSQKAKLKELTEQSLQSFSMPFSWAIRSALLEENTEQIDNYLIQLVQNSDFQVASVAGADNIILASTNKKYEGQPISSEFPLYKLASDTTTIESTEDDELAIIVPIIEA